MKTHCQKTLCSNTRQDYNALHMCSRESCAVVPSRFFAGLLIFLGAFLIGAFAAKSLTQTQRTGVFDTSSSAPSEIGSCYSPDGVEIQLVGKNGPAGDLRIPQLTISNSGPEPIYYFPYDLWVRGQNSPFEYPTAVDPFHEIAIPSGTSLYLPQKAVTPVEAIFRYRIGERRSFRSFTADLTLSCP